MSAPRLGRAAAPTRSKPTRSSTASCMAARRRRRALQAAGRLPARHVQLDSFEEQPSPAKPSPPGRHPGTRVAVAASRTTHRPLEGRPAGRRAAAAAAAAGRVGGAEGGAAVVGGGNGGGGSSAASAAAVRPRGGRGPRRAGDLVFPTTFKR